jgi:hypothetical protein
MDLVQFSLVRKCFQIARCTPVAMVILHVCAMRFCSLTNAGTIWNKFHLCRGSLNKRFVETSGPLRPLAYHGVVALADGNHSLLRRRRLNLTFLGVG